MFTIYIAGPWARRDEVRAAREKFLAAGLQVRSRWLDVADMEQHALTPEQHAMLTEEAQRDIEDIQAAHLMVVLNLEKSEGKAVEQGLAIAYGIPIIAVGPRLNVFQYLGKVRVVDTVDEAVQLAVNTAYEVMSGAA